MIIHYSPPLQPSKRFETDSNSIVIGRKPLHDQYVDIDLVRDEYVSHLHARFTCENKKYWIEDLNSANGTWVNGVKITSKTRLMPGDKIQIGWTIIEVSMEPKASDSMSDQVLEAPTTTRTQAQKAEKKIDSEPDGDGDDGAVDLMELLPSVSAQKRTEASSLPLPRPDALMGASEGTIIDLTRVVTRPYAVSGNGSSEEMLTQAWRQLTAFNDLSQMLSTAATLESLVEILVKHLQKAIPNAQRGAVLLPDERGELLLKAHWPPGDHSVSMTWIRRAYERREPFIWFAPKGRISKDDTPQSAIFYKVQSAIYVPLLSGEKALGVMYVDNFFSREAFFATDLELMRAIANQVTVFLKDHVLRKDLQREEALRSTLARQFPPKVADRLIAKGRGFRSGGERMNPATILVSDVRGFTALSAKMEPDDVVHMVNEMFDAFVPIIFEHDGVVDKYVGDSVLAVFGSPERDDHQFEKAVQAALEMQLAVQKLGEGRRVRRLPVFNVGIGIHTGEVIHGFIGSKERMEYTVVGDTVNQASRYCDGAEGGEVIISKAVYERVYHWVDVRPKMIRTKHPQAEPDLEAFVVKGLKSGGLSSDR